LRIALFTEYLAPPYDEGYKNFTYNLFREAPAKHKVVRLGSGDPDVLDVQVRAGKLCLGVGKKVGDFKPDVVLYAPISSITPASFVRARILKWQMRAPVVMVGLQPRDYPPWSIGILRRIAPDMLYVQSQATADALTKLGFRTGTVAGGFDPSRFKPVGPAEKARLRSKYNVALGTTVVLHVGHINEGRNIRALAGLTSSDRQVVISASTSTPQDRDLARWLMDQGVTILGDYIEEIEEVYQLADVYVFPVMEKTAAIGMPLSVIEAMACNLPVVTTMFGGLVDKFGEGNGLYFVRDIGELPGTVEVAIRETHVHTADKVRSFAWPEIVQSLFLDIEQAIMKRVSQDVS